jgi:hypothetical protein
MYATPASRGQARGQAPPCGSGRLGHRMANNWLIYVYYFLDKMIREMRTRTSARSLACGSGQAPRPAGAGPRFLRFPRFARASARASAKAGATKTARSTKASSFAPPTREVIAPVAQRCSSLGGQTRGQASAPGPHGEAGAGWAAGHSAESLPIRSHCFRTLDEHHLLMAGPDSRDVGLRQHRRSHTSYTSQTRWLSLEPGKVQRL